MGQQQNRVFAVFGILMFIFIAGYIIIRAASLHTTTIEYADKGTDSSILCIQYGFVLRNTGTTGNELYFTVKNTGSKEITSLIIEINGEETELKTNILALTGEEKITITLPDVKENTSVFIYPPECPQLKKEANLN